MSEKNPKLSKLKNTVLAHDFFISEEMFEEINVLNQNHITDLGELSYAKLDYFHKNGTLLNISETTPINSTLEGFLIALPSNLRFAGHLYQSAHRYFEKFIFIERIIVSENYARLGVGSSLMLPLVSLSEQYNLPIVMAINSDPPNERGLRFAVHKLDFSPIEEEVVDNELNVIYLHKTFSKEDYNSIVSFCRSKKYLKELPKIPKKSSKN